MRAATLLILLIAHASPALAHKVNVFAVEEGGRICAEGYTSDGRAIKNSEVEVVGSDGAVMVTGKTGGEGRFCFDRPAPGTMTIKLKAGAGHLGEFILEADGASKTAMEETTKPETGPSLGKILLGILIIMGLCGIYLFATTKKKATL